MYAHMMYLYLYVCIYMAKRITTKHGWIENLKPDYVYQPSWEFVCLRVTARACNLWAPARGE